MLFLVEDTVLCCKDLSASSLRAKQKRGIALDMPLQSLQPHQSARICKCLGVHNSSGTPTL